MIIKKIAPKWRLVIKVIPLLIMIILCKLAAHYFGWEFLSLSSLFTAVISANIFLIGFLISGVLVDYKESEKLPGELACSMETITDECLILYKAKKAKPALKLLEYVKEFNLSLMDWFHKKEKTDAIYKKIRGFNSFFLEFEPLTQANFIVRLKQEQSAIRKVVTRIHSIRETSFLGTGYAIAESITFILIAGLIFIKIDPFYESVFFITFVSFILIYMVLFIKDLDNPFGYYSGGDVEDVSLKPLMDLAERLDDPGI
jgi:hypothetical protein